MLLLFAGINFASQNLVQFFAVLNFAVQNLVTNYFAVLNFAVQNLATNYFAVLNFAVQNLKIAGGEGITNFAWAKFVIPRGEAFKVKTQRTGFAGFLFVQIRFKNGVFGGFEQTKNPSLRRWVLTLAERGDCEPTPQSP